MVAIITDIRRGYSNHHHFTSVCQPTEPIIYEFYSCSATPKFKAKPLLTSPAINTSITTPRVLTIVLGKSSLAILVNGIVPLQPTIVVRSFANRKPTSESHTSTDIRRGYWNQATAHSQKYKYSKDAYIHTYIDICTGEKTMIANCNDTKSR